MSTPATAIALATVEPTWGQAVRVWWSWQWRTILTGIVLTLVCVPIAMVISIMFGASRLGVVTSQLLSFAIFTASGIFQMKTVLDKEYKTFRVAILPKMTN